MGSHGRGRRTGRTAWSTGPAWRRSWGDAVRIAHAATGGHRCEVALALGPYGAGAGHEYDGAYDAPHDGLAPLMAWHAERARLFTMTPGLLRRVGYIAFETVPRVDEIVAVRSLFNEVKKAAADEEGEDVEPMPFSQLPDRRPYWISCVFPGECDTLPDGSTVDHAVEAMLSSEVSSVLPWGIGINCTKVGKLALLVEKYEAAVARLMEVGSLEAPPSLVLYPDGTNGEVYNPRTQEWELPEGIHPPEVGLPCSIFPREPHQSLLTTPFQMPWEVQLGNIVKATARRGKWKFILVGGCCKATHRDIKALRDIVCEFS